METTSWRVLLEEDLAYYKDELIYNTLSEEELDSSFDNDYGLHGGVSFVAWSERYVYYSYDYDGLMKIGVVSRHPTDKDDEDLRWGQ